MTGASLEIRAVSNSHQKGKEMPTIYHQSTPPSAKTSSFNFPPKHHQNVSQFDGLFPAKEFNLVRHIEALKSAANAPLIFPNLNNSSRHNDSLLSIANSGEHTDVSPLRNRPHSTSWAIDPATVPGNLRKHSVSNINETTLTVEDIISRGSSVSDKTTENLDDTHVPKSRIKARRKSNKSQRKKVDTILQHCDSHLARSSSFNAHKKSVDITHHNSKNIDSNGLDALSALCKGITIQQKTACTVAVKLSPYVRKGAINHGTQQSNPKPTVQAVSIAGACNESKKAQPTSHHTQLNRRKSLSKSEEVKTIKVFQSDQQSGMINDLGMAVPCAPPATPTAEQLRRFEYVPSLQDVRAQRSFRQRLQAMELKASQKEMRKQENLAAVEKLSLKERKQQMKKFQRQQIYALNKVMTDLEHERFQAFMHGIGQEIK
ncbi:small vasohibin-binding protein [Plakobranchus ocellatus]|uniref:Small vasohibin-binding protein n=1 Tax=Plakobranchus ocellatus TaxID=259542 RepID=A0AAV4DEK0_9GAST|nr:small vasohibin-binding protein [Plakobranchus ocellatus]